MTKKCLITGGAGFLGSRLARRLLCMPQMFNLIKDPKELYPLDKVDVGDAWFMAPVTRRVVEFQKSLIVEPPIRLGTPDPYLPPKR